MARLADPYPSELVRLLLGGAAALLVALAVGSAACSGVEGAAAVVSDPGVQATVDLLFQPAPTQGCIPADHNGDGRVSAADLVALVRGAPVTCPATPTPSATSVMVTPTPRGELLIPASEPTAVITQLPNGLIVGGRPRMPPQYEVPAPPEARVEDLATGLEVPWSMAFAPDGRLFVSERPGRIRVITGGHLVPDPWATIAVQAVGEGGLMGLALDPDFASSPFVYVCYTFDDNGSTENRISRFPEVDGHAGAEEILLDRFPGARIHNGCRLKFGPDGKLYATSGDSFERSLAQDLGSLAGKILRLNADGSIPADNPFGPESRIYSYGHRNPQGLAFDPRTGKLFETEHGPSGEVDLGAYDEVNIIVPGENYGWPVVVGAPQLPQFVDPLLCYPDTAVPPAGATFYSGALIPEWAGDLFFTSLGAHHLQRLVLDAQRTHVLAIERLYDGAYGRLRDIIEGPDGALYMSTSNRDGRGFPAADDDRILRISGAAS